MKVGIKFGANDWKERLEKSGAKYAEVYFRLDWKEKYTELFEYLRRNEIQFGLHFWALIKGKYMPNLAYSWEGVGDETEKLIRETIDIAEKEGAYYVNFHPESMRNLELDLDRQEIRLVDSEKISEEEAFESLERHLENLKKYGGDRGVNTYVETVPKFCPSHFREDDKQDGRMNPVESWGMPTKYLIELGKRGHSICCDVAHTAAQYPNEPRENIFEKMFSDIQKLAPYTKLVHVNTSLEPLNGTDSHNGVLQDDFLNNVFPSRDQYLKIFGVLKKYPDIWYIPEPQIENMVENYFEIRKLLEEA
jgi:endonuclease IV